MLHNTPGPLLPFTPSVPSSFQAPLAAVGAIPHRLGRCLQGPGNKARLELSLPEGPVYPLHHLPWLAKVSSAGKSRNAPQLHSAAVTCSTSNVLALLIS